MPKPKSDSACSTIGQEIIEGLTELLDVLRSGEPLESRFIVHDVEPPAPTADARPGDDVRKLREEVLKVAPETFARFLGVSPRTLRSWEDGTRAASPVARRFLEEIAADPRHWRSRMKKAGEVASRA